MSRHKLRFFAISAVIAGLTVVVRSDSHVEEAALPRPSPDQYGRASAAGASLWPGGQPRQLVISQFSTKSEVPTGRLLPVQTRNHEDLGVGKLLVANRDLGDPNFDQTVVLLVQQDAHGMAGLILNRRTNVPLSRVLKNLKAAKDRSDPVYMGGPVDTTSMFALLMSPTKVKGAERVFGGVYLISAKDLFEQTLSSRPNPAVFHVYLGYAGWTNEQLRREIELGAWFIFPGNARTVFNSDPDSLWPQMIRKTELKLASQSLILPQGF